MVYYLKRKSDLELWSNLKNLTVVSSGQGELSIHLFLFMACLVNLKFVVDKRIKRMDKQLGEQIIRQTDSQTERQTSADVRNVHIHYVVYIR